MQQTCLITDDAGDTLANQSSIQEENHRQILKDLNAIRNEAMDIFDRVGKFCCSCGKSYT